MRVRILTWNIHKAIGGIDRVYDPGRIVEVIAHYRPDVAFLQEVDEGVPRSRFHRQVDYLGEALGLTHRCYGPNVRVRQGGQYGNAILSRWALTHSGNLDLTVGPKKRRGALHARCRIEEGSANRTLALFNLHLGLAGFERAVQIKRFVKSDPIAHLHPRTPVVVAGDFNDLWGTLGPRYLRPHGFRRAGRILNTYPAFRPLRPLDGIFLRGSVEAHRCWRARLPVARLASDHLPLLALLELSPKGKG